MTPHKHAELIKAWADGAEIEYRTHDTIEWHPIFKGWSWDNNLALYRIKPEPKPDIVQHWCASVQPLKYPNQQNLKLTFDGETGKLKSAEVL